MFDFLKKKNSKPEAEIEQVKKSYHSAKWHAGRKAAGLKAAETNKLRHGPDYYENIGRMGGKASKGGGFALNRKLAAEAGRKGGKKSRRKKEKLEI